MLLIGPSKEPIYMTDPIGAANLKRIASHGSASQISSSLGLPDTENIQSFQELLRGEDPNALESTDVSKEQLLQDGTNRWLSGDQIQFLFAESDEFADEDNLIEWNNLEVQKFEQNIPEAHEDDDGEYFDVDWVKNITSEVKTEVDDAPPPDEKK